MADLLDADDVRLLTEIGFMALSAGLHGRADAIFAGVAAARPSQEAGPIGRALVCLAREDFDEAVALLRPLPPGDAAQTYLGLALARRGDRDEARTILQRVMRTSTDPAFTALAGAVLQDLPG